MKDIFRESSIGQIVRLFSKNYITSHPEELESFYMPDDLSSGSLSKALVSSHALRSKLTDLQNIRLSRLASGYETSSSDDVSMNDGSSSWEACSRVESGGAASIPYTTAEETAGTTAVATPRNVADEEAGTPYEKIPEKGPVLVDWYPTDPKDPANPQNWSLTKKIWVTAQMGWYSFAVYIGSSLYAPAEDQIIELFGVTKEASVLGIALYVFGYGIGPLLWAPLSEIPAIGRTGIYVITFFIFVLLAAWASFINDFPTLMAIRFFLGFFGSPCLATAGATLEDMYAPWKLAYALTTWSVSATLAPALGPIISGFAVDKMGWRWSSYELFWLSAPIWVMLFLTMPETNADTILHRRAQRIRARTGRRDLLSESEIRQQHMSWRQITVDALYKPWQINFCDPAVLFTTIYAGLIYATYYSFFECFNLVYPAMYNFNLGETGLPFLAFIPGLCVGVPCYLIWFRLRVEPVMRKSSWPLYGCPEDRLPPAVIATFMSPIGLFIYAFTARPDIHWMVNIVGLFIFVICIYLVFQCMFFYIARCYPRYAASLFAANDFARSTMAAISILCSRSMYEALGVAGGVSILGGLAVICAFGMLYLWLRGDKLRAKSRFAAI